MSYHRQILKDLGKIKEILQDALNELDLLEIEAVGVNVKKAVNIVESSIAREGKNRRKDE